MTPSVSLPAACGIAAALALPPPARAQAAPPEGVRPIVVHREGGKMRGHLLQLGPATLTLLVDGQRLDVPLATILRIDSGKDSNRNGALIGALIGGGWCALVCGQGFDGAGFVPIGVAINAVFWGAIGAGIDAAIPRPNIIYRARRQCQAPRGRRSPTASGSERIPLDSGS